MEKTTSEQIFGLQIYKNRDFIFIFFIIMLVLIFRFIVNFAVELKKVDRS